MAVRELNLIPYEVRAKNKQKYINLCIGIFCIVIVAGLASFTVIEKVSINKMEEKVAELDAEIASYKKDLKKRTEIDAKVESLTSSIAVTEYLIDERTSAYKWIKGLEDYVPKGIVFKSIEYHGTSMMLTGSTTNYYLITELAANLQESKEYSKSKIANISSDDSNGKYAFTINIKLEKGGLKDEEVKEK